MPNERSTPYADAISCWDDFAVRLCMPEHYLLWAVLQRAIFDRIASCAVSKEDRRSACRFFDDEDVDRDYLFSFHSIAEHLDPNGDPEAFKVGILRYLEKALHAKASGVNAKNSVRTVKPR